MQGGWVCFQAGVVPVGKQVYSVTEEIELFNSTYLDNLTLMFIKFSNDT